MDSIEKAISELHRWRADHAHILESLGSPKAIKVTSQSLSAGIHAAEKIAIGRSLKEVRDMRAVQQVAHEWVEQAQSLCPRRQSKRRVQASNKPTFERLQKLITDGLACPVSLDEEVDRVRRHIAEALSWQENAKSVIEKVTSAFSKETIERRDMWEMEKMRISRDEAENALGRSNPPASLSESKDNGNGSDDDGDAVDREEELDKEEQFHTEALQQLLTKARDISVSMPEEVATERILKIMEWARCSLLFALRRYECVVIFIRTLFGFEMTFKQRSSWYKTNNLLG